MRQIVLHEHVIRFWVVRIAPSIAEVELAWLIEFILQVQRIVWVVKVAPLLSWLLNLNRQFLKL